MNNNNCNTMKTIAFKDDEPKTISSKEDIAAFNQFNKRLRSQENSEELKGHKKSHVNNESLAQSITTLSPELKASIAYNADPNGYYQICLDSCISYCEQKNISGATKDEMVDKQKHIVVNLFKEENENKSEIGKEFNKFAKYFTAETDKFRGLRLMFKKPISYCRRVCTLADYKERTANKPHLMKLLYVFYFCFFILLFCRIRGR